jgi:prolipoprotein diacylglyceryl transferase
VAVFAFISSPHSNGFSIGPFFIHAYGLMYVFAVLASILVTRRRWAARGGDPALVYEVALWAFPAGLVGGRIYFDVTSSGDVPNHWWGPFAVWDGGLGIWGGIALGTLVGMWVLRRRGVDIPAFLDAAAPGLLVAQAIGRIGNYFNQELFGRPTTLPWGLEIDPINRPSGYESYATFQPTFLYELVWNLLLAAGLVWLGRVRRIRPPGIFALYVAGYSLARVGEELLRVDPAHHILGMRLNFWVACALFAVGVIWFLRTQGLLSRRALRAGTALFAAACLITLSGCALSRSETERSKDAGSKAYANTARPEDAGARRFLNASQARTGTASEAIASISAAARSNSSSDSTGVPSNGSSRWISSQERQPPYSSRTLTVTGRGIRYVRSTITWSGWRRFHASLFSA